MEIWIHGGGDNSIGGSIREKRRASGWIRKETIDGAVWIFKEESI